MNHLRPQKKNTNFYIELKVLANSRWTYNARYRTHTELFFMINCQCFGLKVGTFDINSFFFTTKSVDFLQILIVRADVVPCESINSAI